MSALTRLTADGPVTIQGGDGGAGSEGGAGGAGGSDSRPEECAVGPYGVRFTDADWWGRRRRDSHTDDDSSLKKSGAGGVGGSDFWPGAGHRWIRSWPTSSSPQENGGAGAGKAGGGDGGRVESA